MNKRNPRLVPYNLLDEKTKKTNRDTVCAAVRTLIGYGYNIEPPDQESSKSEPSVIHEVDSKYEPRSSEMHTVINNNNTSLRVNHVMQVDMDQAAPVETRSEFSEQRSPTPSLRGSGTLSLKP